jgi:hypothetical protein
MKVLTADHGDPEIAPGKASKLPALGISHTQSSRAQQLARIPEAVFESAASRPAAVERERRR